MMGNPCKMPTKENFDELVDPNNCTSEWVTDYLGSGKNGLLITSIANGNTLFLPAAGYIDDSVLKTFGDFGDYWASTINNAQNAYRFNFNSINTGVVNNNKRCYGYTVRAVR